MKTFMFRAVGAVALTAFALPTLAFAQVYYYSSGNFIGAYAPNASSGYGVQLPPAAQQALAQYGGNGYQSYNPYMSGGYGMTSSPYENESYSYPSYGSGYGSEYDYSSPETYSYGYEPSSNYGYSYPETSSYGYGSSYDSGYGGSSGSYVPCSSDVGGVCGQDTQIGIGAMIYQSLGGY